MAHRNRHVLALSMALVWTTLAGFARADRVAMLPARGSPTDPAPRTVLDADVAKALIALGHSVVPPAEMAAATAKVADGTADSLEEYKQVGLATKADWVLVGSIDPAVTSQRVELTACLVNAGRVEVVAREVDKAKAPQEVQEMLAVLVRPEGIGTGALPWETRPPPPPPKPVAPPPKPPPPPPPPKPAPVAPPPPAAPEVNQAHLSYPTGPRDVWPPYAAGKRGFISASVGMNAPVARAVGSVGGGEAFVGAVRGGYAIGDLGLEILGEFGGNLFGPQALWLDVGARWMFQPIGGRDARTGKRTGIPLFFGPEATFGMFVRLPGKGFQKENTVFTTPAEAYPMVGLSVDVSYALAPFLSLELSAPNFRWVPASEGSIVLLGVTLGAAVRF